MARRLAPGDITVVRQSSGPVTPFNDFDPNDDADSPRDSWNDHDPHYGDWYDW
jgi:hypothetical protein